MEVLDRQRSLVEKPVEERVGQPLVGVDVVEQRLVRRVLQQKLDKGGRFEGVVELDDMRVV